MKNSPPTSINGVIGGISELGTDIVTLASLQARLAAFDLKEMSGRIIPAVVSIAVLIPLAFAAFTAMSFGLAYWIGSAFNLSLPASLGIVGILGLVLVGALSFFAMRRFQASLTVFRRSREELDRNVAWLGTVMKQSGR